MRFVSVRRGNGGFAESGDGQEHDPQRIQTLIKFGADVNAKTEQGITALMRAALNNSNHEVIKALIEAGADINAKSNDGKTVLDYAQNDSVRGLILNAAK